MPSVINKCGYEKVFISSLAKKATTNACKNALVPSLGKAILEHGVSSKNLKMEEFSLGPLSQYVKGMPNSFWTPTETVAMNLVSALVDVMESKKPRCVKACTDILKELKTKLGSSENMMGCMTDALLHKMKPG